MTDQAPELLPSDEREVLAVAEILMTACEGPKGQLHPWRPFDFADVARKCIAALTRPTPAERSNDIARRLRADECSHVAMCPIAATEIERLHALAERPVPQVREAWWEILADNWRGRNGNSTTGDSVRNSCADELEKVANAALTARPSDAAVACEIRTTGDSIESLSLLADAVWSAREDFCDSMGSKHEATYRRALENVLWNDKGGIALALRELVDRRLALPPDEPARVNELRSQLVCARNDAIQECIAVCNEFDDTSPTFIASKLFDMTLSDD